LSDSVEKMRLLKRHGSKEGNNLYLVLLRLPYSGRRSGGCDSGKKKEENITYIWEFQPFITGGSGGEGKVPAKEGVSNRNREGGGGVESQVSGGERTILWIK